MNTDNGYHLDIRCTAGSGYDTDEIRMLRKLLDLVKEVFPLRQNIGALANADVELRQTCSDPAVYVCTCLDNRAEVAQAILDFTNAALSCLLMKTNMVGVSGDAALFQRCLYTSLLKERGKCKTGLVYAILFQTFYDLLPKLCLRNAVALAGYSFQ
jgi:hypothetical protein